MSVEDTFRKYLFKSHSAEGRRVAEPISTQMASSQECLDYQGSKNTGISQGSIYHTQDAIEP